MSYVRSSRLTSVDVHVWVGSSVEDRCGCWPASARRASHDSFRADCEADPAITPDLTAACGLSRENRGLSRTHHDSRRRVRDKPRDAPNWIAPSRRYSLTSRPRPAAVWSAPPLTRGQATHQPQVASKSSNVNTSL